MIIKTWFSDQTFKMALRKGQEPLTELLSNSYGPLYTAVSLSLRGKPYGRKDVKVYGVFKDYVMLWQWCCCRPAVGHSHCTPLEDCWWPQADGFFSCSWGNSNPTQPERPRWQQPKPQLGQQKLRGEKRQSITCISLIESTDSIHFRDQTIIFEMWEKSLNVVLHLHLEFWRILLICF